VLTYIVLPHGSRKPLIFGSTSATPVASTTFLPTAVFCSESVASKVPSPSFRMASTRVYESRW